MRTHLSDTLQVSRLRPLAACLAIAFSAETFAGLDAAEVLADSGHSRPQAILASARWNTGNTALGSPNRAALGSTPEHPAATFLVTNCNDDGQDSLRSAVAAANTLNVDSAIEFDLNAMGCSIITLTTGEIDVTVENLTIGGPGPDVVTIDGGYSQQYLNRIFKHTAAGVLHLDHLVLTDAKYVTSGNQQALGGCVYSLDTAYLSSTRVDNCHVVSENAAAQGGGVFGHGVKLVDSVVSNSSAQSQLSEPDGGGIFSDSGGLDVTGSMVRDNFAQSFVPNPSASGGGVESRGATTFQGSTVSGNTADFGGGILSTHPVAFVNSSIVGNTAIRGYGAMDIHDALSIFNSTVAFNEANEYGRVAGVTASSVYAASTIFADNVTRTGGSAVESDVRSDDGLVSGSNNLIMAAETGTTPPMDTLTGCPRLAPLLDNGGPTLTLALLPGSPAIDAGYDPFALGTDQRGTGFDRVVGANADIGAYEWSEGSGDVINGSGFETCE